MERQGLVIVFNGELYGAQPLKQKLSILGYQFETDSDTEILLNAFIEFGVSILPELVGMFAFAIWNSRNETLYLARDRFGEKPLYYTSGEGFLSFASEIKALKCWPFITWNICLEDLHVFLKHSYLPHPRTGWQNIFKLEPGYYLTYQKSHILKKNYFSLEVKEERNGTLEDAKELLYLLKQSVKECSVSDKPIGAFLSGGLDSTTIAFLLTQNQPHVPVFSLHWNDESYSEELYTQKAALDLGLNHHSVVCDESFFINYFDSVASLYDEPFADESMIPTYCLAKFAKQEVDVILTGDGSDEFFHGYERYFFEGNFEQYLDIFAATSIETHKLLCNPEFLNLEPMNPLLFYYSQESPHMCEKRRRSIIDIKSYLPDDILMKVDRACMGVGLEARAPFLTPQVTNFALNCTTRGLLGKNQRGKEILRSAMKSHLPPIILERKKMGFGMPLSSWFKSSLKEWVTSRLLEGSLLKTGWFSEKGIHTLISNHMEGNRNYSRTLLNLLVLELWLKRNQP